jgi:hypothetical protein
MKHMIRIAVVTIALACVGCFLSCSRTVSRSDLVGTWLYESTDGVFETKAMLRFKADGTYSTRIDITNPRQVAHRGVDGGTVITTYPGTNDWDEIQGTFVLEGNELVTTYKKTASSHSSPDTESTIDSARVMLDGDRLTLKGELSDFVLRRVEETNETTQP